MKYMLLNTKYSKKKKIYLNMHITVHNVLLQSELF